MIDVTLVTHLFTTSGLYPQSQQTLMAASAVQTSSPNRILTVAPVKAGRIGAIDFTKGTLVLFMVLYHWLNYFFGPQGDVYKYLRFLTPSFIFITGFVISHVLLSKPGSSRAQLPGKLTRRGLKILGLFLILNVIIALIIPDASVRQLILNPASLMTVIWRYALGDVLIPGIGKIASFYILVPIGYLLIISGCLIAASNVVKHIFAIVCAFLLLSIFILGSWNIQNGTLELVAIGLVGVVAGQMSRDQLNQVADHPYSIMGAYGSYLVAITIWGVPFPLCIAGVFLTLMLIYVVGSKKGTPGAVRQGIITLGEYSLFGYIVQIAILQVIHRVVRLRASEAAVIAGSLVVAAILTIVSVKAVAYSRSKAALANRLYRAVFA